MQCYAAPGGQVQLRWSRLCHRLVNMCQAIKRTGWRAVSLCEHVVWEAEAAALLDCRVDQQMAQQTMCDALDHGIMGVLVTNNHINNTRKGKSQVDINNDVCQPTQADVRGRT